MGEQLFTFVVTSAKKIVLSAFVSLLAALHKTTQSIFTEFGGKMVHWPRKRRNH